jgi:hypothetical protein
LKSVLQLIEVFGRIPLKSVCSFGTDRRPMHRVNVWFACPTWNVRRDIGCVSHASNEGAREDTAATRQYGRQL